MRALSSAQRIQLDEVVLGGLSDFPPAALEKDLHLTAALDCISKIDSKATFAFCGGTSLSKCFGLLPRMSEDADFKFTLKEAGSRANLKKLKLCLKSAFEHAEFTVVRESAGDDNRYFAFWLAYEETTPKNLALRNELQIEFTYVDGKPVTSAVPIRELVSEALGIEKDLGVIDCLSIEQTIAEKVLSLLKRTRKDQASTSFDPRILRHVFDVFTIESQSLELDDRLVEKYFREAMAFDLNRYGKSDPLHGNNAARLLKEQLDYLESHKVQFEQNYNDALASLVIGELVQFSIAWSTFSNTATRLIESLNASDL